MFPLMSILCGILRWYNIRKRVKNVLKLNHIYCVSWSLATPAPCAVTVWWHNMNNLKWISNLWTRNGKEIPLRTGVWWLGKKGNIARCPVGNLHGSKTKPVRLCVAEDERAHSLKLIKDPVNWLKLTGSCHSSGSGRSVDNRQTAVHCATRRWSWWHWANGHVRIEWDDADRMKKLP